MIAPTLEQTITYPVKRVLHHRIIKNIAIGLFSPVSSFLDGVVLFLGEEKGVILNRVSSSLSTSESASFGFMILNQNQNLKDKSFKFVLFDSQY